MTRLLPLLLLTACTADPLGSWLGECLTDQEDVRVRLEIWEMATEDRPTITEVWIHLADRPEDSLALECADMSEARRTLWVDACDGAWSHSPEEPVTDVFSLEGTLYREDSTDELSGACTFDQADGELLLWRIP